MSRWFRVITTMSTVLWFCSVLVFILCKLRRAGVIIKQGFAVATASGRLMITAACPALCFQSESELSSVWWRLRGQKCQGSVCVCLTLKRKPGKFFLKLCMTTTAQELMSKRHWLTMLQLLRGTIHTHTHSLSYA